MKAVLWEKAKSSQKPKNTISASRLKKIDRQKHWAKQAKKKAKELNER